MKKLLLLLAMLVILPISANASQKATLFHPMTGERKVVEVGEPNAFNGGFELETPFNYFKIGEDIVVKCDTPECTQLGYSVVSRYRTRLSSSMSSTQATVPVASLETFDGHTLTMADLGSVVYLTIEPGSNREEIVKCTTISGSSWATCTRGLAFYGTTETSVAANRQAHNAGSIVVMSNVHYVYEQLTDKDSAETISGLKTYSTYPEFSSPLTLPTTNGQFATKYYVDNVGAGGFTSVNASTTKGLQVYGTSPETVGINASSTTGLTFDANGALYQKVSSTQGIASDSNGLYIDTSDTFNWTGQHTFSNLASFSATTTFATTTVASSTITNLNLGGVNANTLINGGDASTLHIHSTEPASTDTTFTVNDSSTFSTALDSPGTVTKGAILTINTTGGTSDGDKADAYSDASANASKDFTLIFRAKFTNFSSSLLGGFGITETAQDEDTSGTTIRAKFIVNGTTLYTVTSGGSSVTSNDVTSGITITNFNLYKIQRSGSNIYFYINGTLVATHTTNLPTSAANKIMIGIRNSGVPSGTGILTWYSRIYYKQAF